MDRRIFAAYDAGQSPRRIASSSTTINGNWARGTGILNNELYIGRLVWNRLRYVKDPETGKPDPFLLPGACCP